VSWFVGGNNAEYAEILRMLNTIHGQLAQILTGEQKIMAALDTLESDVTAETDVENSAIVLLNGLGAALKAAGTDPARLAALATTIETRKTALAAAVAANTPAA
jgi:uncharacterized protein YoxC